MKAMLARHNVDRSQLKRFVESNEHYLQPKHDGHRVICKVGNGRVRALNRNGEPSQHQETMKEILEAHANTYDKPDEIVFDGELINRDTYVVFDTPKLQNIVEIKTPYSVRLEALKDYVQEHEHLYRVSNCQTKQQKLNLIGLMDTHDGEGVIVRDKSSGYELGKRSTNIIKCKFYKTVDLVVMETEVSGKQKFNFGAFDGNDLVKIGGTKQIYDVAVGDVIELRYLSKSESHPPRLTQPVLLRKRIDKAPQECTFDQF